MLSTTYDNNIRIKHISLGSCDRLNYFTASCLKMKAYLSFKGVTLLSAFLCQIAQLRSEDLPKLYEHFTRNGIKSGLVSSNSTFTLNGEPIKILSGAIHYFRVHPHYWRDRLRKLRAAGFNAVETYAPWNLHEPRKNVFDFGDKNQDFSAFLNVRRFLEIAQEEDLLVVLRPGPYICAEWDFGGLPSWLQRDEKLEVRRYNRPYLKRVEKYFNKLLPLLAGLKFTAGGPIVALQIENEYGFFEPRDKKYLEWLTDLVESFGYNDTLLFTADPASNGLNGTLPGRLLHTLNFAHDPVRNFNHLDKIQNSKPRFVMEYYPGFLELWFAEKHLTMNVTEFLGGLDTILGQKYNGNVNIYMFHGGTNFGFMSGALPSSTDPSGYSYQLTSYDYLAPLSEAGDPTALYFKIMDVVDRYQSPRLHRPKIPKPIPKKAYGQLKPIDFMRYETILQQVPNDARFFVRKPTSMEDLPMNDKNGQSYGYIVHRSKVYVENGSEFEAGVVKDFGLLLVDGAIQNGSYDGCVTNSSCYWMHRAKKIRLDGIKSGEHALDLFIENMGRRNFGGAEHMKEKKGLPDGFISLNGRHLEDFEVIALEFKSHWVKNLVGFEPAAENFGGKQGPLIARFVLDILDEPEDTFVSMRGWHKGIVLINGFNLGRYWKVGPQQNLYVPAPLLKKGSNTILVFEEIGTHDSIWLEDVPDFGER